MVIAIILDGSQAVVFLKKYPEVEMNLMPKTDDSFAIAFPKGSKWVTPFNKELQKMRDNGKLNELIQKWLAVKFKQ